MSCDDLRWRKSSYSGLPDNDCVEICFDGPSVLIRDSKNPVGPVLRVSTEVWADFIDAVRRERLVPPAQDPDDGWRGPTTGDRKPAS
jgi:hypothetical protein